MARGGLVDQPLRERLSEHPPGAIDVPNAAVGETKRPRGGEMVRLFR